MSDFANGSNPQIGPEGTGQRTEPASGSVSSAWRHSIDLVRDSAREILLRLLSDKRSALIAMIVVLALPIAAGIVWYIASPSGLRKSQAGRSGAIPSLLSHGTKAKPAPGKPMGAASTPVPSPPLVVSPAMPAPQTVPPSQTAIPGTTGNVAPPPVAGIPPSAPVPVVPVVPQNSSMVYQAKHDKAFGGGCSGQLLLSSSGLAFTCLDDPSGSMQIALNQIGAADENGVRLLSGKKYHFSIRGMTKDAEQTLFLNWLHKVR